MKVKFFWLVLVLVLALTACGGGETAVANPPADLSSEELNLGPTVDVATVAAIMDRDDVVLIDVREQAEYDEAHIPDITLIPLGTVPDSLDQIPTDKTVIMTCRSGNRSGQATEFLRQQGFDNVHNMEGGIVAWQAAGFAVE
jgi:rhodanese-related sulfurtransferase